MSDTLKDLQRQLKAEFNKKKGVRDDQLIRSLHGQINIEKLSMADTIRAIHKQRRAEEVAQQAQQRAFSVGRHKRRLEKKGGSK